jgi:hypothetical protein
MHLGVELEWNSSVPNCRSTTSRPAFTSAPFSATSVSGVELQQEKTSMIPARVLTRNMSSGATGLALVLAAVPALAQDELTGYGPRHGS